MWSKRAEVIALAFGVVLILLGCGDEGPNRSPVAVFSHIPQEPGYAPLEVSFDASPSTDPDGRIVRYEWDFGDGETARGNRVTHVYGDDGEYTVTLTVWDDRGASDTASAVVEVLNPPPVARFTWRPQEPAVGQVVIFDATGSYDPAGALEPKEVVSWHWDFGDGTQGEGPVVEHVYLAPGTYTVTLTVTDDDGATATNRHPIIVALPVPPLPPG